MITSSRQKLCYGKWELLQVLVIPWRGLWWAKWSRKLLSPPVFLWHSGSASNTLIPRPQCSFISSVYTKKKILANKCLNQMKFFVSLYIFFLCVNVCIQKMNVFKNDNWPEDYSLCLYLSMSASLLTECCESEKGLRFGEMASASWILMISLKDFLYKILYC